jgi:hypothetical protein
MIANSKFQRIARDLEKLPCELHEAILADLEFHQLIRLSSCAGPRLIWSLENSLSPWGCYFLRSGMHEMQKLLAITDQVRMFCLPSAKTKHGRPYILEHGDLRFLLCKSSEWKAGNNTYVPKHRRYLSIIKLYDKKILLRHWLCTLTYLALSSTWPSLHQDHAHLIEPWASEIPEAEKIFQNVPYLGQPDKHHDTEELTTYIKEQFDANDPAFTVDELASFVSIYQQIRLKRAQAIAQDLYRLADLYEAYPRLLKTPLDPRPHAPSVINTTHIPSRMRQQAQRTLNLAKNTHWLRGIEYPQSCTCAPLVPHTWCVELFNAVVALESGLFLEQETKKMDISGDEKKKTPDIKTPLLIREYLSVPVKPPTWAVCEANEAAYSGTNAVTTATKIRIHAHQASKRSDGGGRKLATRPHLDDDLQWLKTFTHVTACLEQEYPQVDKALR